MESCHGGYCCGSGGQASGWARMPLLVMSCPADGVRCTGAAGTGDSTPRIIKDRGKESYRPRWPRTRTELYDEGNGRRCGSWRAREATMSSRARRRACTTAIRSFSLGARSPSPAHNDLGSAAEVALVPVAVDRFRAAGTPHEVLRVRGPVRQTGDLRRQVRGRGSGAATGGERRIGGRTAGERSRRGQAPGWSESTARKPVVLRGQLVDRSLDVSPDRDRRNVSQRRIESGLQGAVLLQHLQRSGGGRPGVPREADQNHTSPEGPETSGSASIGVHRIHPPGNSVEDFGPSRAAGPAGWSPGADAGPSDDGSASNAAAWGRSGTPLVRSTSRTSRIKGKTS